jgi:hypothetical protein
MYLNTFGIHPQINGGKKWSQWQAILINDNAKNVYKGFMVKFKGSHLVHCPESLVALRGSLLL